MRLRGAIPFGVPALTSMRHGESQVIEPDAFGPVGPLAIGAGDSAGVYLLLGYDYANVLASTRNGSLAVRITREAIEWSTAALAKTAAEDAARRQLRARLVGGAVAGFAPVDVGRQELTRGILNIVRTAMLCEINLVSRPPGDGSTVERF